MSREDYEDEDDARERWNNNIANPNFIPNMVKNLRIKHGDKSHLYALEKILNSDEITAGIWREVLEELDKGEGQ
jgi:hypothetical protein